MSAAPTNTGKRERRGEVLDVARELLAEGRTDEILSLLGQLVAQNSELTVRASEATMRADQLEKRLEKILARVKKNESVSKAQLVLFIDALSRGEVSVEATGDEDPRAGANERLRDASGIDEPDDDEPKTKPPRNQPGRRKPAPAHLPRVPNPIAVPAAERPCPRCGKERRCIGHDVTEVIELIPAQVIVRQDQREKLACDDCESELVRAPLGDKVVPGGRLGHELVIDMLIGKYADGLPLHRQKERYARLGLPISVSTLVDQVTWVTDLLRPLWRAAVAECIGSKVMHLDSTGLPVLDRDAPGGKRLGSLWGYVGDDVAAYVYATTGKKVGQKPGEMGPEDILALREGYTVADASSVFDASFQNRPALIECGCHLHSRRYFFKALEAGDKRAALPLAAYKKLYDIEDKIRDLEPDEKLASHQKQSKPVSTSSWRGPRPISPTNHRPANSAKPSATCSTSAWRWADSSSLGSCRLTTARSNVSMSARP